MRVSTAAFTSCWARPAFAVLLSGCSASEEASAPPTCAVFEPAGVSMRLADPDADRPNGLEDLVAHPFPSDALVQPGGAVRLSQFPNPTQSSTLQEYLEIFEANLGGFATSAATYVGFTGALDPASIPTDPGVALTADAPIYLVDIDAASPERGRRYPLQLRYGPEAKVYLPAHHLIALPPFGAALRGATTYALVVTNRVRSASGAPLERSHELQALLSPDCADQVSDAFQQAYAPLAAWLQTIEDPDAVVGAAVFTTRDAVGDVRALATAARAAAPTEATEWRAVAPSVFSARFEAQIELPGFQSGERPYLATEDGGALVRTDNGFQLDHRETAGLAVSIPQRRQQPPDGWPVVLYSHGTGGRATSIFQQPVADAFGAIGIAVIGYDGTLHGPRDPEGSDPNLTFFNLFNPVAARDNVLQGAADLAAMTEALPNIVVPASVAGQTHRFDRNRMAFVGHSQGALVGAPFLAADNTAQAVVFSGLGAILTITLLERSDIVNFRGLLTSLLEIPDDDPLDDFHPVLNLIQHFIEPADPIAYARSFRADPAPGSPASVLMVTGFLDEPSPKRGQDAFSVAGQIPIIQPQFDAPVAAQWLGPDAQAAPAQDNVMIAGGAATYGVLQYPEEGHFPIFQNRDATRRYVEFVRSALIDGTAVIVPPQ